ncbi:MAG: hypothetical protein MUE73_13845 [Planctomycetes bacterium]|jgi:hypothetical protein|nr:hypothetical protein [Planctomycetota bacterium]
MALHITGLVRFHDQVRAALARGVEGKERDELAGHIRGFLRSVEGICARHGVTPAHLPVPSRNAYRSLASIDLDRLPVPRADDPAPSPTPRLTGVVSIAEWLGRRMWRERRRLLESVSDRALLEEEIRGHLRQIEDLCRKSGGEPSALPPRTRLLYAWMRFLVGDGILERHLAALEGIAAGLGAFPAEVHLRGVRSLWRRTPRPGHVEFVASEGFLHAPPEILRGLAALVRGDGRGSGAAEAVQTFTLSPDFARVIREMDEVVGTLDRSRGRHHDLAASFGRVNAGYFGGRMSPPALGFGRTPSSRKLAHYEPAGHRVLFSSLLDDPAVSELVIDCLMHHELLHAVFGVDTRNGRRVIHGPEFRRAERRFAGFEEAHLQIAAFLRHHRARGQGPPPTPPGA